MQDKKKLKYIDTAKEKISRIFFFIFTNISWKRIASERIT